jgi:hypothetical protein
MFPGVREMWLGSWVRLLRKLILMALPSIAGIVWTKYLKS